MQKLKADMDYLCQDTMEMHNLLPREYAEGTQRAKEEAHFQMEG